MPGLEWAWLAPVFCLAAFAVLALLRPYLPRQAVYLSIVAVAAGFVLFWFVLLDFLDNGEFTDSVTWFDVGYATLSWGMIGDALSVVMLGLVTFVALAIQVYSLGYMREDPPRLIWYFAVHSLFAASMLILVLADNFLLLYISWELVGLCSYLLIGFWYERRSAAEAAKKAFVTTRIGDVGMLIGILLLFHETETFDMSAIFHAVEQGGLSSGMVTVAGLLIFLGAMGKSAQFPLHVWLPDAMEGPSPVSALIHAATMVVAGVFLVARAFPLFQASDTTMLVIATVGLVTALMAASMALVMTDLKRILAYSTVSHLGFMMLALGAGGLTAGMFHLITHASAKALLFLGAGSLMHHGLTDLSQMGGLRRRMPLTFLTFAVGALALGGIVPFSGFFSKDEVLLAVFNSDVLGGARFVFFVLALGGAFLSALYMARILFVVFFGRESPEAEHVNESPAVMTVPMLALAIPAAASGFIAPWVGKVLFFEEAHGFEIDPIVTGLSLALAFGGFYLGWAIYHRKLISAAQFQVRYAAVHRILANKFYLDDLYQWGVNRIALAFGAFIALFDRIVINDVGVNGTSYSVILSGLRLRLVETGKVYNYALGITLGAVLLVLLWWLVVPLL